jgi:hypothetical protein
MDFNIVLMLRGEVGRDAETWVTLNELDLTDVLHMLGQFPKDHHSHGHIHGVRYLKSILYV